MPCYPIRLRYWQPLGHEDRRSHQNGFGDPANRAGSYSDVDDTLKPGGLATTLPLCQ